MSVEFVPTDHSRMASMREALKKILEGPFPRLDVLMCNAGTMACPPTRTIEGYDIQFATNYMSHALAVHMLLPTMIRTQAEHNSDVRIVLLTSEAYMLHPSGGIDWANIRTNPKFKPSLRPSIDRFLPWGGEWMRYAQSQLAIMLLALELSHRYPQIRSIAVMPASMSDTNLIRTRSLANRILIHAVEPVRSPEFGAMTQIWAAGSDKYELANGGYYQAVGIEGWHVRKSRDVALAAKLWNWTVTELGLEIS
ncbi:oxidoreductase, short-chain dehydrogenase/reductase family [Stemphylium lycopersici]|nr:oxidoreductase, short-chain dehydrogenase/reductase family [Stemphylium lycopersici]